MLSVSDGRRRQMTISRQFANFCCRRCVWSSPCGDALALYGAWQADKLYRADRPPVRKLNRRSAGLHVSSTVDDSDLQQRATSSAWVARNYLISGMSLVRLRGVTVIDTCPYALFAAKRAIIAVFRASYSQAYISSRIWDCVYRIMTHCIR